MPMRTFTVLVAVLLLAVTASAQVAAPPLVVINEFQYDDSGTDDREFVELYNADSVPADISGWVLEALDNLVPDNNADYTIPGALGSGTVVLAPGAFYVLGSALVPGVSQVVGATNLWENDVEAIALWNGPIGTSTMVDVVRYEANKVGGASVPTFPAAYIEGAGVWGNFTSIDATMQSWSRWIDGRDTNDNGYDFGLLPATPGAPNAPAAALPYFDDFNTPVPGTPVTAFRGSFLGPHVIDPTVAGPVIGASNINPNAIAASPDGGNCMILWDNTGGGDSATLVDVPASDFYVEAWVYFDAVPRPANESEQWSIGVRGTTDTYFNFMNPGFTADSNANGNTGIHWHYTVDQTGGHLRLVDDGNGGDDEVIVASIAVTTGFNDGWQRLRLQVTGNQIDASVGGTYGSILDGTRVLATTATTAPNAIGTVYLGYREFITANPTTRPLTLDFLTIRRPYLTKDTDTVNALTGGTVNFGLHGGLAQGGLTYAVLLSATAGDPGPFIGAPHNTLLPVVPDLITTYALLNANLSPLFANYVNVLDGAGEGTASSTIPPIPGLLAAVPFYVGWVSLASPVQLSGFASNQAIFTIAP